ncbi:MAG TPA: hypothetical protein VFU19_15195 [Iamia sp.]|nr:hypothetical protein [Iamia sp.]
MNPAAWGRHPLVRIPSLVVGGLLTVALLAGATFAVANVLVRTTETDATTLTGEVRRAVVHVTGSVEITTGPVDRVEIARRSTFGITRPRISETLDDGLLTVRVECVGGASTMCTNRVELVVPAAVSITIDALGVDVADVEGDVEIESGAGSVDLDRLAGEVAVSVGGGSVHGRELRSPRVRASAGAGSVDLGFVTAPEDVEATSGAGSVVVELPPGEAAYRVDADAGAGSDTVTVKTDQTSDRLIRANAGAGSVQVRYRP